MNSLRNLVFGVLVNHTKKFFEGNVVDREDPAEAFYGHVRLTLFDSPVLNPGDIEVISKILVARIAFLLTQIRELGTDAFQRHF